MQKIFYNVLKTIICVLPCFLMLRDVAFPITNVKFIFGFIFCILAFIFICMIWANRTPRIFFGVVIIMCLIALSDYFLKPGCMACLEDLMAPNHETLVLSKGKELLYDTSDWQRCFCASVVSFAKKKEYAQQQIEKMGDYWIEQENCTDYAEYTKGYDFPLDSSCFVHSDLTSSKGGLYLYNKDSNKLFIFYDYSFEN